MKSHIHEFYIIIIIITNIKFCSITMKLSSVKFIIIIINIISIISIIINIIKSCGITMRLSDIEFLTIAVIFIMMKVIINIIKSCSINIKLSGIKLLTIAISITISFFSWLIITVVCFLDLHRIFSRRQHL